MALLPQSGSFEAIGEISNPHARRINFTLTSTFRHWGKRPVHPSKPSSPTQLHCRAEASAAQPESKFLQIPHCYILLLGDLATSFKVFLRNRRKAASEDLLSSRSQLTRVSVYRNSAMSKANRGKCPVLYVDDSSDRQLFFHRSTLRTETPSHIRLSLT
jgi:hypothetical protein